MARRTYSDRSISLKVEVFDHGLSIEDTLKTSGKRGIAVLTREDETALRLILEQPRPAPTEQEGYRYDVDFLGRWRRVTSPRPAPLTRSGRGPRP